jgi:hypothetical protein
MFCADYIAAFVCHGLVSLGLEEAARHQPALAQAWHQQWRGSQSGAHFQQLLFHVLVGSFAGNNLEAVYLILWNKA